MTNEIKHKPVTITPGFYKLGTTSFPSYLSMGDHGMIIEGGTGATANIIIKQLEELGVEPERIQYLALTHTHADHIGAVPHLKNKWPHLKIVASKTAVKILKNEDTINNFARMDNTIAEIMYSKGEIEEMPPVLKDYSIKPDLAVTEGQRIDLGSGVIWEIYDTKGHSPCHISLFEEKEKIVAVGDATGFYVPQKDEFWPNYFYSLTDYLKSLRKLLALPARRGVLSHNHVIGEGLSDYLRKAISATEAYHFKLLERLKNGEDPEAIAMENAKWVSTLTDDHPFEIMYELSKVLIKRSKKDEAHVHDLLNNS